MIQSIIVKLIPRVQVLSSYYNKLSPQIISYTSWMTQVQFELKQSLSNHLGGMFYVLIRISPWVMLSGSRSRQRLTSQNVPPSQFRRVVRNRSLSLAKSYGDLAVNLTFRQTSLTTSQFKGHYNQTNQIAQCGMLYTQLNCNG